MYNELELILDRYSCGGSITNEEFSFLQEYYIIDKNGSLTKFGERMLEGMKAF